MVVVGALADEAGAEVDKVARRVTTALPLWVLIIIVVVGTGLLALSLGLCCLYVCRRHHRRGHGSQNSGKVVLLDGVSEPASDCGSSSYERGRRRGKLQKRQPPFVGVHEEYVDDRDHHGKGGIGFREISPVRKVSLLVMPDMFWRRGSLNPLVKGGGFDLSSDNTKRGSGSGSGGGGGGGKKRTSNAWVDEDALHGPKMTSAVPDQQGSRKAKNKSWRKSLRESWPLKTLSPTLPRLPQFEGRLGQAGGGGGEGMHDSLSMFQYKNYNGQVLPELPPPPGIVTRQYEVRGVSPPRPLPQPPKQALLAASRASAGGIRTSDWTGARSIGEIVPSNRGLSYYRYEDTEEPVKSTSWGGAKPGRGVGVETVVAGPKGGSLSLEGSTLSVILKDTELRLQEGTATGVAKRNRLSTSPPKRAAAGSDGSTATLVGSAPRTPSPAKSSQHLPGSAGAASSHTRQTSDASVLSEADSMVGDGSPGLQYHGLTSPSRSNPQQQQTSPHRRKLSRAASFTSSMSSSLSDISEENSMVSGTTPNTTAPNSSIPAAMNKTTGLASDPFMSTNDTSPASNRTRTNPGVYPASHGAHSTLERQRGGQTSDETMPTISQSPLSLISGNSRSPEPSPTRKPDSANKTKPPQTQRSHPAAIFLPAPAPQDNPSDSIHKRTSPGQSTPPGMRIPNLSLTSPSVDGDSPTPKRTGILRRLHSPPTLIHSPQPQEREQSPDMVPPSPALSMSRLSSVYDCYANMHTDPSSSSISAPARRRAAGEVRMMSNDTKITMSSSSDYSDHRETYEREKTAVVHELNALLNQNIIRAGGHHHNHHYQQQRHQQQAPILLPDKAATVRLVPPELAYSSRSLRVSAMVAELRRMNSQISSHSSAAASGYSDDSAATVRPEVVSPPRKGAAARNYLALGSPPKEGGGRGGARNDKETYRTGVNGDGDGDGTASRGGVGVLGTPVRKNRWRDKVQGAEGRRSEESLGLYDEDGFLISPERKLGLRA